MCIIKEIQKAGKIVSYRGYWYSLSHVIEVLILGLLCRLQTLEDIHEWSNSRYAREMLYREFGIRRTVVTDALNCQKKTVDLLVSKGADYVLAVKKNQHNLYDDISEMVDFKQCNKVEQHCAKKIHKKC